MADRPVVKREDIPDLYDALLKQAVAERRSVAQQAAWYIKLGLERQGAHETKTRPRARKQEAPTDGRPNDRSDT